MRVGYARVSRKDQKLEPQRDMLLADGCERVFEKISSQEAERKALREAFDYCREGDLLVVAKLDRPGRSPQELIDLVADLESRGVSFRSLEESMDTTTAGGRSIFRVFGALAEFEREIFREMTMAGFESARARGRRGGRPRALDEKQGRAGPETHGRGRSLGGGGGVPGDSGGQDGAEGEGGATGGVPDVSGMDAVQATGILLSEGYAIEPYTETEPGSEPPGTVIGTDPPAGTQAPRGTAVRLIVSGGSSGDGGQEARPVSLIYRTFPAYMCNKNLCLSDESPFGRCYYARRGSDGRKEWEEDGMACR